MDSDQRFGIVICSIIAVVLITLTISTHWYYREQMRYATENGYTQKPGGHSYYWTKE